MTSAQKKFWIPAVICILFLIMTLILWGRPVTFVTSAVSVAAGVMFLSFHWLQIVDWFNKDN